MADDFDPAALMAALDATEAAGVPPHLVERLRELVRREVLMEQVRRLMDFARDGSISQTEAGEQIADLLG